MTDGMGTWDRSSAARPVVAARGSPGERDVPTGYLVSAEQAFAEQSDRLWRAVRAYSGSADVASDAVAEAFAQLIRRGEGVRDPAAWVWRTAFRIAAGELKRQRRFVADGPVVPEGPFGPSEPVSAELIDLLADIGALSPNQRMAIILQDYAGHTARSAAEIAGSTEAAMRVHLMRGRRSLRTRLAEGSGDRS